MLEKTLKIISVILIINSLVKDKLKGNLEIRSKKDKGTTIEFDFKN